MSEPHYVKLGAKEEKKLQVVLDALQKEFDEMKWVKNYKRKNASDGACYSMSFGQVNRFEFGNHGKFGVFDSSYNATYPRVLELLDQLSKSLRFSQHTGTTCSTFCISGVRKFLVGL